MPSSRREALGKGLGLRVMIFILSYIYYALWKQYSSYRDEPNGAVMERFRGEPGQRVQKDTISIQIVAQMDELFGIDGQARQASPLQLTFTRHDLDALLVKIATKRLASAA